MLPGITSAIVSGGQVGPVVITRTASVSGVNTSGKVGTYSSVSIGTASSGRIVVLLVGTEESGSGNSPSSATIDFGSGDTAMTALTLASVFPVAARIFYLAVPTGTTATFKVTYSDNVTSTENYISVYSVTGGAYSSGGTDTSSDMDSTDPLTTGSITIPADGGFLAVASSEIDTNTKTWANATEDLDLDAGGGRYTTAISTTAGTVTVTCTGTSNGENGALAWVIFNPA